MKKHCVHIAGSIAIALSAVTAIAAPDEIQVYNDDINAPGESSLELHVNYSGRGIREPQYPGYLPPHHVLQTTAELSYGWSKNWEIGLYIPFALAPGGNLYENGLRGRVKYIAPQAEGNHFFWGLNLESGYSATRVSESHYGWELRPIIGYKTDDWMVAANPIINANLSKSDAGRAINFAPAIKGSHKVAEHTQLGLEYYGDYGRLSSFAPKSERSHYLFAALDTNIGKHDLNLGIGRGFNAAEDKWVLKASVSFPFD